ncbi:MAG: hypothetical protein GXX92_11465 [Clostridiales bacterium]|nr:hypothetical protein [Clostridiales bacterium]
MKKRGIPILFIVIHLIIIVLCWLYIVIFQPVEVGEIWEYLFGVIDFAVYYTVGIPQIVANIGVTSNGSYGYVIWFGFSGSIQWLIIGLLIRGIFHNKKSQPVSPVNAGAAPQRD